MFQPISVEELTVVRFHKAPCKNIYRLYNERAALPFGEVKHGLLCHKVSHHQIVVPHALKQRVMHVHHYVRWPNTAAAGSCTNLLLSTRTGRPLQVDAFQMYGNVRYARKLHSTTPTCTTISTLSCVTSAGVSSY